MSAELPMTRRILLAEDDNDMRRFLERALEQHRLDAKTFITIPPGETLHFPRR